MDRARNKIMGYWLSDPVKKFFSQQLSWHKDMAGIGMTPKSEAMPQTIEEWRRLAGLYEKQMLKDKEEIARLKQTINKLRQGEATGERR